jgi:single-strand DNA-binding protein
VTISGSVTEREWTDKDGQKRKSMDVRVNDLALQGGKKEAAAPAPRPAAGKPGKSFDDFSDPPF